MGQIYSLYNACIYVFYILDIVVVINKVTISKKKKQFVDAEEVKEAQNAMSVGESDAGEISDASC